MFLGFKSGVKKRNEIDLSHNENNTDLRSDGLCIYSI